MAAKKTRIRRKVRAKKARRTTRKRAVEPKYASAGPPENWDAAHVRWREKLPAERVG